MDIENQLYQGIASKNDTSQFSDLLLPEEKEIARKKLPLMKRLIPEAQKNKEEILPLTLDSDGSEMGKNFLHKNTNLPENQYHAVYPENLIDDKCDIENQ